MRPRLLSGSADAPVVLTCEHASALVPPDYADLGLARTQIEDHIGWDIGAASVTEELSRRLSAPAVLSAASRLLIDCNRQATDHDLIVTESHGVVVPGNAAIDDHERTARQARFYDPYHAAVDSVLVRYPDAVLLSIHSFTPSLNGSERNFDVGVLFDAFDDLATDLAARLRYAGLTVRMNEPYSGFDGLIFSARSHGQRHGCRYLELEVNNRLLRTAGEARAVARTLAGPLAALLGVSADVPLGSAS